MRTYYFIFLLLIGCCAVVHSQVDTMEETSKETRWGYFKHDIGSVFGGMGYAYSRPLHWQKDDWATFGAVSAGTILLHFADDETSRFFRKRSEDIPTPIRDFGYEYGSPTNNFALTGAVYLTGLIIKDEKLRRTGVLLVSSAASAGLLQQVVKTVAGRGRPRDGFSPNHFRPFGPGNAYRSFPSGHAMMAMTNAHAIAKQFQNYWVKSGIYLIGAIPSISRVWEGAHWLTDVALSVVISIATVESIDRYLDRRYDEKYLDNSKKVSWDLKLLPGRIGVVARF